MNTTTEHEDYKSQLSYININGARLAYHESGTGELLILVHANLSDIRSWDGIFPLLAEKFRVFAYSRRYAWPNEPISPGVPDPWDKQADDLAALIKKLNVGAAHVVGNSTGATLGLLVAQKHPELIRSLILEEPPVITLFLPNSPPTLPDILGLLVRYPLSFLTIMSFGIFTVAAAESAFRKNDDNNAVNVFARGVLGAKHMNDLSPQRCRQMMRNAAPHKAILCHGQLPKFLQEDAVTISVPTFLLTAERTAPAQKCINFKLARLIPGAKEIHISEASHFMHEDDPKQITMTILSIAGP